MAVVERPYLFNLYFSDAERVNNQFIELRCYTAFKRLVAEAEPEEFLGAYLRKRGVSRVNFTFELLPFSFPDDVAEAETLQRVLTYNRHWVEAERYHSEVTELSSPVEVVIEQSIAEDRAKGVQKITLNARCADVYVRS